MRHSVKQGCCVALFAVGIATTAFGGDEKIISGAWCRETFEGVDGADNVYGNGFSQAEDDSYEEYLSCGLLRDNITNTTGFTSLKVRMNDASASEQAACTGYAYHSNNTDFYSATAYSGVAATGQVEMTIALTSSYSGGSYSVTCTVPNAFILENIKYDEP